MARGSRKKAATNAATSSQGSLVGTREAAPKKKTRRSDDEIIADLQAKLDAAQTRKKLTAVAGNKPLVAAIKAAKRLGDWLTEQTYEMVQTEIEMIVEGNAPWISSSAAQNDDSDDDDPEDHDDSDDGGVS